MIEVYIYGLKGEDPFAVLALGALCFRFGARTSD